MLDDFNIVMATPSRFRVTQGTGLQTEQIFRIALVRVNQRHCRHRN